MLIDVLGRSVQSQKREIRFTNRDIARFAAMADTPFRVLNLTVICLQCGGTPQMANHPGDAEWVMECACTRRVLANPDRHLRSTMGAPS